VISILNVAIIFVVCIFYIQNIYKIGASHASLFTNGIMGEKYLINIVEKENPAN
jgi:low affinity Fe/Cu permease